MKEEKKEGRRKEGRGRGSKEREGERKQNEIENCPSVKYPAKQRRNFEINES